ncbi:hypothetical protein ZHAS_00008732 [Anopheles sinensis]|uniref:Uncharacterized protein n=1 Tax=Anopheles sinensis TaxID=74873 RepID=A0A084VT77_ANOSI|nr:hypothetical protein ZHAS_00008732 [Anopheles sinensis]
MENGRSKQAQEQRCDETFRRGGKGTFSKSPAVCRMCEETVFLCVRAMRKADPEEHRQQCVAESGPHPEAFVHFLRLQHTGSTPAVVPVAHASPRNNDGDVEHTHTLARGTPSTTLVAEQGNGLARGAWRSGSLGLDVTFRFRYDVYGWLARKGKGRELGTDWWQQE